MPMLQGRRSIRTRLVLMSALTSGITLALACSAFLAYELVTFRQSLVADLTTDAETLAFNVTAPLLFDDPIAASASLSALRAKPRIRSATLANKNGQEFASFVRKNLEHSSDEAPTEPDEADAIRLTVPVISEGQVIGTLSLQAGTEERGERIRRYLALTGLVLLVSLLAEIGISSWLQRRVLQPILRLTEAAQQVSRKRDYAVRVNAPPGRDELGLLANTFNDMLVQIERQNSELNRAVVMRDEFLSVASHELKTPLTPIQLHLQTLMRQATRDNALGLMPRIQILDRQVHRLSKLVDDLLNISRLSTRKVELNYEEVDLVELVKDVVERYQAEAIKNGCELKLWSTAPVVGLWDSSRLEQVLVNLISNALKYGAGMPVELTVGQQGDRAVFVIRDHGIGIREEDISRIFKRFERAVSERHYGGFGLGLWIVREILASLGGTISAQSQLGQGARFIVELPLKPAMAAKEAEEPEQIVPV